MTSPLVEKLSDVRDFRKILETTVKEIGEIYSADVSQIILSNPLDSNFTSICEYLANPEETPEDLASTTFPVHLEGGGLGLLSVSRQKELESSEINEIRITLADIADILRYAQINDLVQRDTFRSAFQSEITNLMSLPMGLGDALFMVVNILGKALACSRCIFICVDEAKAAWRSYEYWQRERVESAQDMGWPTKDSAIVSQTMLSAVPIITFEGQINSYKTPVQEEMEFIGVRSQLTVAIRSSVAVHGAIILQQCESRHAWTRDEIDMLQSVADTVAEALAQLPDEKKEQATIMSNYQHDVAATKDTSQHSMQEVRKALKGALGASAIPKAQKAKPAEATPSPPPLPPPPSDPQQYASVESYGEGAYAGQDYTEQSESLNPSYLTQQTTGQESLGAGPQYANAEEFGITKTSQGTDSQSAASMWDEDGSAKADLVPPPLPPEHASNTGAPMPNAQYVDTGADPGSGLGDLANMITSEHSVAATQTGVEGTEPPQFKGALGNILSNQRAGMNTPAWDVETSAPLPPPPPSPASQKPAPPMPATAQSSPMPLQQMAAQQQGLQTNALNPGIQEAYSEGRDSLSGVPPSGIPRPGSLSGGPQAPQGAPASKWGDLDSIPGPGQKPASKWGDLDNIGAGAGTPSSTPALPAQSGAQTPPTAKPASNWGNLDSIPSPGDKGAQKTGAAWGDLDSIPSPAGSQSRGPGLQGLMGNKAKSAPTPGSLGAAFTKGKAATPASNFVEGPPIQIDEAAAEAKLKQILASSNPTSDFIFATPGVDMRLLGRIDGWVTQVELKDKYVNGHSRSVAEYSSAIARLLGMTPEDVNQIRLAAIVHDVGKLGLPQAVLQKPDEHLTDAELVMTMNHTIDGAKLIEGFPELAPLAPIVLSHHEEFNGEGYPGGHAGEDIPLGARIIHCANAYTELVSDLVYRAGMPPEQAQNLMIQRAGTTYDPNAVEALIACISQGLVPPRIV